MAKKSKLTEVSTVDLEKEIAKRKIQENAWEVRSLESIPEKEKIKVFNELYKSNMESIDRCIEQKWVDEDLKHYVYEETMEKIFGKDVFAKCLNKIQNNKDVLKIVK